MENVGRHRVASGVYAPEHGTASLGSSAVAVLEKAEKEYVTGERKT